MIEKMAKLWLVGSKSRLAPVTNLLHDLGVIHVESSPVFFPPPAEILQGLAPDPALQAQRAELERAVEQIHRLFLILPHPTSFFPVLPGALPTDVGEPLPAVAPPLERLIQELAETLRTLVPEVEALVQRKKDLEDRRALYQQYERTLEALAPFLEEIRESRELVYLGVTMERKAEGMLALLRELLGEVTRERYQLFYTVVDPETLALLIVLPKEYADRVRGLLWERGITELRLPLDLAELPLGEALRYLLRERDRLPDAIAAAQAALAAQARRWRGRLELLERWALDRLEQIRTSERFFQTDQTFIIYGWVPRRRYAEVAEAMRVAFAGEVLVEELPLGMEERFRVPVVLKNPAWIRPFERLTRVVALPRYGTLDPTPFLALFFPLFFGLIIADIAHGLILLAGSLFVRRRYGDRPLVRDLAVVFGYGAVAAILSGFLFGEFFGAEPGAWLGLRPILFDRLHAVLLFMGVALGVGVFHILLGLGLGLATAWLHGGRREMAAKGGGLLFLGGFLLFLGGLAGFLPEPLRLIGIVVSASSLPVLFLMGGPKAAMELHNIVNVLSYLRLMGFGLAAAALSYTANRLGGMMENVVLGLLVAGFFHLLNLVFGLVSPAIQALRLHYVEFFENFFQPGGREYKPFRKIS